METIRDITAEMREFAVIDAHTIGRDVLRRRIQHFARRIDEAVTNCNQIKMRESLNRIHMLLWDYLREKILVESLCRIIEKEIDTALSAPPRNCDKFSKAEVLKMLEDRSFSKEDTIEWLFAEAEGETDEQK